MRAGRLVSLLLMLERRGRMTATQLSQELEVSVRTVLRDIEELSGAGVPIYATRGSRGGYELLGDYKSGLAPPDTWGPKNPRGTSQNLRRAKVRISPEGRQLAIVLGRLTGLRFRPIEEADEQGWRNASFRMGSIERAALDILSLGPEVEVVSPPELRTLVKELLLKTNRLYSD